MTPEEIVQTLATEEVLPLKDTKKEAVVQELFKDMIGPVIHLLEAEELISSQDHPVIFDEAASLRQQIGTSLGNSLLPFYGSDISDVGPRLAKLLFDVVKARGFEDAAMERLISGLIYAFKNSWFEEDEVDEDDEGEEDEGDEDDKDKEDEEVEMRAHV